MVDAGLVRRAADGDRAAASMLWQRHRRWIAVVLVAHKSSEADLDDLLQEVACTLVARVGDVRDPTRVRPWLRMVAINAARASARSMRRRTMDRIHGVDLVDTGGEALHEAGDDADHLLHQLNALPEEYREPLLLRCLHEMSTRRIAQLLELPETTVETRVSRARRMLRERSDSTLSASDRPK